MINDAEIMFKPAGGWYKAKTADRLSVTGLIYHGPDLNFQHVHVIVSLPSNRI